MNDILADLNPFQAQAVEQIDGPLLILAGAGSGKTKTLTSRLAYMIDCVGIPSSDTLTLTFTNKAAVEMRNRALLMVKSTYMIPPLLCTFHKFGLLFLKFNIHYLGRKSNFVVIDSDDKKKIIKSIISSIPNCSLPLSSAVNSISSLKNSGIFTAEAKERIFDTNSKQIARCYEAYEAYLLEKNLIDFDDLLLLTYDILHKNSDICAEYSLRYNYIMVDEYQDTNLLQYNILSKLCTKHKNICVVGDDDQSIYGWRGADINNILNFTKEFEGAKIIKLEDNYRSTSQILSCANALISNNIKRLGKTLRSVKGNGEEVRVISSIDERDEALNIAREIKKLIAIGVNASEIAILFRLNALSRGIEDGLLKESISYKLIGAVRFYERSEIKDILAYFRLVVNIDDDFSLLRIINKPRRGIGKVTQERVESFAKSHNISIFNAISKYSNEIGISNKHLKALNELFELIFELKEIANVEIGKFIDMFKDKVNILDAYDADDIDREANIDELCGYFKDYVLHNSECSLEDFLNDIALSSDSDDTFDNQVCCMSIHSAKGLEFDYVFVVGCEEGFFPILSDTSDLQEERRLGYVAFTRAKKYLSLCYAKSRFYKGKRELLNPSRFLKESNIFGKVDDDINSEVISSDTKIDEIVKNDLVNHKIFGAGRVMEVQKSGLEVKLLINFGGITRVILSSFVTKI